MSLKLKDKTSIDANLLDGKDSAQFASASHTHSYLPLAGGTITGKLTTTGAIDGSAITTSNKQLMNVASNTVYVGNPTVELNLESNINPKVKVGSALHTLYHTGNKPTKADVGLGNVSNLPIASIDQAKDRTNNSVFMTPARVNDHLQQYGYGNNAPLWNGSHLNDLPIGVYTVKATGVPEAGTYHIVICIYNDVAKCKIQIAMSQGAYGNNGHKRCRTYCRTLVNGSWSNWSPMDGETLGYSDARNDGNKQPSWYITNKRTGMTLELNSGTSNGMPSNHLYHVTTTLPWYDTTGGVIQTAINVDTGQQYIRNRVNDTTWNTWKQAGGGGNAVKSVQSGRYTYSSANNHTVKISAVNVSKSFVLVNGFVWMDSTSSGLGYGYLENSTNLILSFPVTSSHSMTVAWQVIEFY